MKLGSNLNTISSGFNLFNSSIPVWAKEFISLFLLSVLILVYAIIIWKFYRFISKKNIFKLNLRQYNKASNPELSRFLDVAFYFLEYIFILPILVIFWFMIFSLFLVVLTRGVPIAIISAIVISAIRMTAYYKEDLSKDLAKLLPFTILGIAIIRPASFSLDNILNNLKNLGSSFPNIWIPLSFIITLELLLRASDLIINYFKGDLEEEYESLNK